MCPIGVTLADVAEGRRRAGVGHDSAPWTKTSSSISGNSVRDLLDPAETARRRGWVLGQAHLTAAWNFTVAQLRLRWPAPRGA